MNDCPVNLSGFTTSSRCCALCMQDELVITTRRGSEDDAPTDPIQSLGAFQVFSFFRVQESETLAVVQDRRKQG